MEERRKPEALARRIMRDFYGASMELDADLRSVYRRLAASFRTRQLAERRMAMSRFAGVCPLCFAVHPDEERVCLG